MIIIIYCDDNEQNRETKEYDKRGFRFIEITESMSQ